MTQARVRSHYRGVTWEGPQGKHKRPYWKVRFSYHNRVISLLRFRKEEDAARFSDVARDFLKPGDPMNLDGEPPPGWTRNDILLYLVDRGLVPAGDLAKIIVRYKVSKKGEIGPRA